MSKKKSDNVMVKMSMFFFARWRYTILLLVFILGFGAVVYTNLIKKEGFPPIQFPVSFVSGTYFVDSKDKMDQELATPVKEALDLVEGVNDVTTISTGNFFQAVVVFDGNIDSATGKALVEQALNSSNDIPEEANLQTISIDPAAYLNEFDMLLSVYSTEPVDVAKLEEVATFVSQDIENDPLITNTEKQALIQIAKNPATGEEESRQTSFNIIGLPDENGELQFYPSITVGVDRDKNQIDIIELSKVVQQRIDNLDLSQFGTSFRVKIGADFAPSIENQISSLESNLLTGLIAVSLVSLLLITWRASIITAIFMITVMATTLIVLYLVGYTLNTITLFALVLSLGLFVDDATIVVESIDAAKKKGKKSKEIVHEAISKIGAASFAGTMTTVLVFLPLAFLTGVLGEFIRLMPVTVIIALLSSLLLSLTLIPVLSKFILLKTDGISWFTRVNPISKLESWLGKKLGGLPRLLKTKPGKGKVVMGSMILLSIVFVLLAGMFASKLSFNIFPPSKDSDQIGYQITFPPGYDITKAESTADQIDKIVADEIGSNVVRITYGSNTPTSERSADALIELVSFRERDQKSPEMIEQLQNAVNERIPNTVSVRFVQYDAGPPLEQFPLKIQIRDEDIAKATALSMEVENYIKGATIERSNGTTATIIETKPPSTQSVIRVDGRRTLEVSGAFDADDTSGLLTAAETYVTDKFTPEYLVSEGYAEDALGFDFGQESENADSFASLAYAFPIALLLMFILLAAQFRSFLQPLLIFMAIPFTLFGVFAGLYFTDNALSFFVQVGLIGLIGIAVNNTILLTEYANQEKRAGVGTIDAISNAVTKRFRPLVATTITTVVALLPLALSDPFWESLAFTIIFGLLSSTFLVILSFPYYYLAAEWLRMRISKGTRSARKLKKA